MPEPISHAEIIALRFAIQLAEAEGYAECAAGLRAVLAHLERTQWRPLPDDAAEGTAPFDGRPVLIRTNHTWTNQVHRAIWTDAIHGKGIFGWAIEDCKFGPYPLRGYTVVTEWMPLPLPPSPEPRQTLEERAAIGTQADLTERAHEYLDDWFGLGQWPPVHRFVELLTGFAQSEREAAAAEARRAILEALVDQSGFAEIKMHEFEQLWPGHPRCDAMRHALVEVAKKLDAGPLLASPAPQGETQ